MVSGGAGRICFMARRVVAPHEQAKGDTSSALASLGHLPLKGKAFGCVRKCGGRRTVREAGPYSWG